MDELKVNKLYCNDIEKQKKQDIDTRYQMYNTVADITNFTGCVDFSQYNSKNQHKINFPVASIHTMASFL